MTSFHLIIAVAALLVTLGLTMVLSASGVHSYDEDGSPWIIFAKQVLWTVVGLVAFYVALRMPVNLMRRLAFPGFVITIIMLVLVLIPGIGKEANGSRGWFVVAGFSMQPSELAKIAFADLGGAHSGAPPDGAGVGARDAVSAGSRRRCWRCSSSCCSPTSARRCR